MKKGFTLVELMVVVVIIGILAMLSLPLIMRNVERARATEGLNVLGEIRASQLRYALEHILVATEAERDELDVEVDPVGRYFDNSLPAPAINPADEPNGVVGIATRKEPSPSGPYVLSIQADGDILCTDSTDNMCDILETSEQLN